MAAEQKFAFALVSKASAILPSVSIWDYAMVTIFSFA
jgi:hypothetical protein